MNFDVYAKFCRFCPAIFSEPALAKGDLKRGGPGQIKIMKISPWSYPDAAAAGAAAAASAPASAAATVATTARTVVKTRAAAEAGAEAAAAPAAAASG